MMRSLIEFPLLSLLPMAEKAISGSRIRIRLQVLHVREDVQNKWCSSQPGILSRSGDLIVVRQVVIGRRLPDFAERRLCAPVKTAGPPPDAGAVGVAAPAVPEMAAYPV
jgi:hypothetical protein